MLLNPRSGLSFDLDGVISTTGVGAKYTFGAPDLRLRQRHKIGSLRMPISRRPPAP